MESSNLSNNPYAVNEVITSSVPGPLAHEYGMFGHLMAVGILQIVFGALEFVMGGFLAFYAVIFSTILPTMKNQGQPPMSPEVAFWIAFGCGTASAIVILFSLLRIGSGISSFWYRGRTWMLVSLIGGIITSLTCYCAPFSIGIGVYGLIVVMNPPVIKAYQMGASGMNAREIKALFTRAQFGL